jgi:aerobic carbon-monoxide dehydrogenase small subunit
MTITLSINGKHASVDIPANKRLVDILRDEFELLSSRAGCYGGVCGNCEVLYNGKLVHSCLVPAFSAQGSDIVTAEGLSRDQEFNEVIAGFQEAGATPCENCRQSKTLSIYALLRSTPHPTREDVARAVGWHHCRCIDIDSLCRAVDTVVSLRRTHRNANQ